MDISNMADDKEEKIHTSDVIVAENYLFTKFLLSDKLLQSLRELNYFKPSPIQLKIIPLARSRLDMIIQSKSGTGKTLAFSICLLETYDEDLIFPQAIIIVPTREIAVQITNTLNGLGRHLKHFKACEFIGGTDLKNDRKRIQTTKIVVGTPGRILHLINNEIFNVSQIKAIVFDEADKLFEQGHLGRDVQSIFKAVDHKNLQIIAATATVTEQFEAQIKKHMKNPLGITPKQEVPILLGIKQFIMELPQENDNIQLMRNKLSELEKIFTKITFKQCLLFTDSQSKTESYGSYLKQLGWKNEIINGSQEQSQRLKVLNKLAKFKCRILITTDLMARGIDIENINLVINLDLPYDCFTYLHRIGRAGRFGTYGIAITMLNGEKDSIKFEKMLSEIGTNDSMVWKYPENALNYNFWDFNNLDQNEKLSKFDKVLCDQNGNNIVNGLKTQDEIVDENLMLLEITKKLIDHQQLNETSNSFDTESLLEEYEKGCVDDDSNLLKKCDKVNEIRSPESTDDQVCKSNLDTLLEDYERNCTSYSKDADKSCENGSTSELKELKEKRKVIFVRNQEEDQHSISSSESSDSEGSSDYDSLDEDVEHENTEQNYYREPEQSTASVDEYQLYNQYVMDNYQQWRRTFYFQLANIQNFVSHN